MIRPKSVGPMQTAKIGYIVMSVLFAVLGICLILFPDISVPVIGAIIGAVMIVFGAVKLIGYFSKDLYRLAFQYDLATGILLILLGTVLLFRMDKAMHFLCIALGIFIAADGLFKIQIAADAKRFGIARWWLILSLAILTGLAGILLILRPTESIRFLTVLLGLSLLAEGILNLSTVLTAVKIIHYQMPDIFEAEDSEERMEENL